MDTVNEILKWPVILQGALGSLFFWLVLTLGQKAFTFVFAKLKGEKEVGNFWGRNAHDRFYENLYEFSNYSFFVSLYGALHYFLKFVAASFVALLVAHVIPVFGYIGYLIAFYFLFRSISYVPHFSSFPPIEKKNPKVAEKTTQ